MQENMFYPVSLSQYILAFMSPNIYLKQLKKARNNQSWQIEWGTENHTFQRQNPTQQLILSFTLGSYSFQPHIHVLQPTRIMNYSAILIDNIFINSIEHYTITGNIVHDLTDHSTYLIIFNQFTTLPCNV